MDFIAERFLQATYRYLARQVATFLQRGVPVEVPLTDDLMARISVVDTVAAVAADKRDASAEAVYSVVRPRPPITVDEGKEAALAKAEPFMRRCACHAAADRLSMCWEWRRTLGGGTRPDMTSENAIRVLIAASDIEHDLDPSLPMTRVDELAACLPFLCRTWFGNNIIMPQTLSDCVKLPLRGKAVLRDATGIGHQPDSTARHTRRARVLVSDPLGVYHEPPELYKAELMMGDIGCVACHPQSLHGWSREALVRPLSMDRRQSLARALLQLVVTFHAAWGAAGGPARIQLTAWSADYCPVEYITQYGDPLFVIVSTRAEVEAVAARGFIPLMPTWTTTGAHATGNMRVVLAALAPVGVYVHITNAFPRVNWIIDTSVLPESPVEMSGCSYRNGVVCSGWIVGGATSLATTCHLPRFARWMGYYGVDEVMLEYITRVVNRVDHCFGQMGVEHPFYPSFRRTSPLVLRSMVHPKWAEATGVTRAHTLTLVRIVETWQRRVQSRITWNTAWTLPVGAAQDRGPCPIESVPAQPEVAPGRPQTLGGAISADLGVVNWFVFGSHGDVIPVLALARRLKAWGINIHVVRVHTEEEGRNVIFQAERGELLTAAPVFLRTMATCATAPGLVMGPPEFSSVAVAVNFRPPSSVVYPADFGAGALVNFIIDTMLRGWAPQINIGAYRGITWFPRSADGHSFLVNNRDSAPRPVDIMLVWGSCTLPKPEIDGAVEPITTDHYAEFSRAKVVVCHGGAGTVQTAAAAGARVVAATSVLDRRYRDPLDAGRGVDADDEADRIMLALLPHCSLVWIWAWKHSYAMFVRACLLGFKWVFGPALWVVLALFVKSVVFVLRVPRVRLVFTLSLPSTLIATVLSGFTSTWWAMIMGPQVESLLHYVFAHTGLTYTSLFLWCAQVLATCSLSPVTWALVLAGHPVIALPTALAFGYFQLGPLLFAELFSLMLGTTEASESGFARVGISWAWPDSNIPAFHTRFISPDGSEVLEGVWVNGVRQMGALYSLRVSSHPRDIPNEWTFPTKLKWDAIKDAPPVSAPYSPLWNCQTSMLHAARGAWCLMGLALLVLMPSGLLMLVGLAGMTVAVVITTVLVEIIPVVELVLMAIGRTGESPLVRQYLYSVMRSLLESPSGWFGTATSVLVGLNTGWGDNTGAKLLVENIVRADSVPALVEVCKNYGHLFCSFDSQMYIVKMDALIARDARVAN